jgi:hypothetical protein
MENGLTMAKMVRYKWVKVKEKPKKKKAWNEFMKPTINRLDI